MFKKTLSFSFLDSFAEIMNRLISTLSNKGICYGGHIFGTSLNHYNKYGKIYFNEAYVEKGSQNHYCIRKLQKLLISHQI